MTTRERVSVELDTGVAAILRKHAAEAHATEGEIIDRAVRAYDLRALLRRLTVVSRQRASSTTIKRWRSRARN